MNLLDRLKHSLTGTELPAEDLVDVLNSERRRRTIRVVDDINQDTVDFQSLVDAVAQREYADAQHITSTQRKRVYIGLYQHNLPKLEDAGVLQDVGDQTYERGPNYQAARNVLGVVDDLTGGEA